jgi:hypothetical protein
MVTKSQQLSPAISLCRRLQRFPQKAALFVDLSRLKKCRPRHTRRLDFEISLAEWTYHQQSTGVTMSALLLLLAIGYLGYRLSRLAPRARRRAWGRFRDPVHSRMPVTRAQASGDAGEAAVQAELRRVMTWLCGDNFYLHEGAVLIHHASGSKFPTGEIDHLLVAPFGIFVIETKNWTGVISPGAHRDEILRTRQDGTTEVRRSPVAQNRTKVAFLNAKLPRVWPIEGLAVFAFPACTLHPDLPLSVIHISELAHWLRERRLAFEISGRMPVNVKTAWRSIMLNASIAKSQIDSHNERLRTHPKVLANDAV